MFRTFIASAAAVFALFLTGCATTSLPANTVGQLETGKVLQIQQVKLKPNNGSALMTASLASAVTGAITNQIAKDKDWRARSAITTIGAALGGIGARVAAESIASDGYEYVVRLSTGRNVAVTAPANLPLSKVGSEILVINTQGIYRVVDNVAVPVPATASAQAQTRREILANSVIPSTGAKIFRAANGSVYQPR